MFVDKVSISLKAGNGGNGLVSFRHEKFRPLGGPDGGDGGDGGDIILRASHDQNTLATFRYQKLLKAQDGKPGTKARRRGKSGQDLEVKVPLGTVVFGADSQALVDLANDGQTLLAARGGRGGFGNAHFVSSTRQAPKVAEKGEAGEQFEATLELKMIADVGIIGLPNAGKSTFLSVISNAKPEIADYPFTTLRPNLGVVDIDGKTSRLFADIPGLISGASQGKGLGDEFLRHVERTSVLVHLLDAYNQDVGASYQTIISELKAYSTDLSRLPQVVALTKVEGMSSVEVRKKIKVLKKLTPKTTPVEALSSRSGQGVKEILRAVEKQIVKAHRQTSRKLKKPRLPVIGLRAPDNQWQAAKIGNSFIITGSKIERFAARTDFNDPHGQARLRDIMTKMGILRELQRLGIEFEQDIVIGEPEIGRLQY